jgi:uncharacterized RmlC-like cupin family protein
MQTDGRTARANEASMTWTSLPPVDEAKDSEYAPVHIAGPARCGRGTAQTPGSLRLAAIAPETGVTSNSWGGLFTVEPGACTGIHHDGEQQTISCVLSGVCEIRWGARGEYAATATVGDFIHVPAFLPHLEINPSRSRAFQWVVVRSTSTPIVVDLPDDTWGPTTKEAEWI